MMTERTCETCANKGDCSIRHMVNNLGCYDWEGEPRPSAQYAYECPFCGTTSLRFVKNGDHNGYIKHPNVKGCPISGRDVPLDAWNHRPSLPMSADSVPVELLPSFTDLVESVANGEERTEWKKGFKAGVIKACSAIAKDRPMSAEVEKAVETERKRCQDRLCWSACYQGSGPCGDPCSEYFAIESDEYDPWTTQSDDNNAALKEKV
jgi:hypothetical protein